MSPDRIARLAALFDRAQAVPPGERAAFVQLSCGGDEELRREVLSLLQADESAGDLFDELSSAIVSPVYDAMLPGEEGPGSALLREALERALEGRYRIGTELSGGALSRVFLAEEIKLGRKVVIKVLPQELAASMSGERFRREIQLAAQLQHPHIVPLLTSDSIGGLLYYTMPFVEGESLRTRLAREGPLPLRDAVKLWHDLLDALGYAHGRHVVHRDIKPANILLNGRNALVADFGIARAIEAAGGEVDATTPGLTLGTPAYMAPEQVVGDPAADQRVDLYAAGLVMYEMLEGRLPFPGRASHEQMAARLGQAPAPLTRDDWPPELAKLVLQCLAKQPEARPASAEAVLAALELLPIGTSAARVRASRVRAVLLASVLGVAALGTTVLGVRWLRQAHQAPVAAGDHPPAIAVLPLKNLSPAPEDASFADAMTEELIGVLSKGSGLRVVASTSVLALQSRGLQARQIAESLRVSNLVEGSLQKIGSKLQVQIRLFDPHDGSTRWSETYDAELRDAFAVYDSIAHAVAGQLDVRLGGATEPARRPTSNVAAYDAYLRAKNSLLIRTAEGRQQGIAYYLQAIAADPNFAGAHAGIVWLYLNNGGDGNHRGWFDRAEEEARQAVALDESLPEGHSALGWALLAHRQWSAAERELRRAIALNPGVYRGYEGLARLYMSTGRPGEQLAAARQGLEVDPYSVQAIREMALALNMNNRCPETLELLRPLKELSSPAGVAGMIRGLCYARMQRWSEAISEFGWAEQHDARAALAFQGYALARGGHIEEAKRLLEDLLSGRKYSHGAFGIAVVYTGLRNYDQAFVWFERAEEESSTRVYLMDPLFDDLHRDPRFAGLMKEKAQKR